MTIPSSRSDRRRFLRDSALATAGIAAGMGFRPLPIGARLQQGGTASRGQGTTSLSRQFAEWVVRLRYEDLPAAVVDRAKGVTLQNLASALLGSQTASAKQAMAFVAEEEAGVSNGGTIMVSGAKVTRGGAAFANAEMMFAGGKWDTFRMLTHPGTAIIPAALVATENARVPGRTFITAVAAGYE